ncbi:MAG: phosphoribosylanthranilate isomerase [Lachnospiraceae bacterium]|nr:phosphoribosylanthranilate isomerase [Lachnospiraceae bacterium]
MTKIKFCGLSRPCDIEAANILEPDYIGFVFAKGSKRYVTVEKAMELKRLLKPEIRAVGVFVDAPMEEVLRLLSEKVIDCAQLHGNESDEYVIRLKELSGKPVIKAFKIKTQEDLSNALQSSAEHILLDAGAGTGTVFDWRMLKGFERPFFLAGGIDPMNAEDAVKAVRPYALDVSSGIETDGFKDRIKMVAFKAAVKRGDEQ